MKWRGTEMWERMRYARDAAGFKKSIDAARALDVKPGTYRTYEHSKADGGREPALNEVQRIARKYRVQWTWLLTGEGDPEIQEADADIEEIAEELRRLPKAKRGDAAAAALGAVQAIGKRR